MVTACQTKYSVLGAALLVLAVFYVLPKERGAAWIVSTFSVIKEGSDEFVVSLIFQRCCQRTEQSN